MASTPWPPEFVKIADSIRRQISTGGLQGGDKLPSGRVICERWGVSATVARRAVTTLQSEGLVYGVRGKGVFVRKAQPVRRVAPQRYWRPHDRPTYVHEAETAGRAVGVQHATTHVPATREVARRLGIEPGAAVTQTTYLITMDDQPVSGSVCWEPLAITGGTPIQDPHAGPQAGTGIVPRFDSVGLQVDGVTEVLTVRMPDPIEIASLEIAPGVPLVEIAQTFNAGGCPVETADIMFAADRYTLEYHMGVR